MLFFCNRKISLTSIPVHLFSSLSYVFSLFKLSEEKAAEILVSLCIDMGDSKVASSGKLLFFGSRILKSPEGKAALAPIKEMIKATYREAAVAETMVDTSQQYVVFLGRPLCCILFLTSFFFCQIEPLPRPHIGQQ
jgi:hypothetical protein